MNSLEASAALEWRLPPLLRSKAALSTISFSRFISTGPKVSGRLAPILTPVQPLSLCEAVTMATQGTFNSNCAK